MARIRGRGPRIVIMFAIPFLMSRKTTQASQGHQNPVRICALRQAAKYTPKELALEINAAKRQTDWREAGTKLQLRILQKTKMTRSADK